ncbi:DsbA family protein [Agrobacterium rubi]|uniref:DsbA family protein n=1 Tax=Agrobacterium rubi TaxID=28099 RepID=A0AAE7R4E1_9HYPH|nr:DsbA family protein [Agrobacterium rubi]NTE85629.1 DsbA family protein [Agrobacterium rubi]NTF01561.1 DsbA family protein [Agrobacterium rubi]NTF35804.1 DsbA family protein [Agrobacterium rubi]OCJ48300.1 disulfide bond formation protein DsbA [Agrobacterium rubi]QTG00914.1 DsbA family protein [Agrobacterium rubi]
MHFPDFNITRRNLMGGIALAAVAAALPFALTPGSAFAQTLPESSGDVDMTAVMKPGPLPDRALGDPNAPVKIVEYMSMTCPHCAHFHNTTFDEIKKKYIDTGKVYFVIREFPFDPRAAAAFMLARCAPEQQYYPFISMLFKQQQSWATAQDARAALLQMSKLAGFSQETFEACLTNQKLLDDVNATMQRGATEFGVNSTPTFIVNGKRYAGDMSVENMSALVDSLL